MNTLLGLNIPDYVRSLPTVVLYTLTIYVFLILGFRFFARRTLGQLNVVDLVIIVIMGSAVETAMIGGNISLPAGLVSATTLLVANRVFAYVVSRSKRLRRLIGGGPVLVVSHGHIIEERLKRNGLTEEDVMEALRERGCCDLADVKYAVMEEDGEINVVEMDHPVIKAPPVAAK